MILPLLAGGYRMSYQSLKLLRAEMASLLPVNSQGFLKPRKLLLAVTMLVAILLYRYPISLTTTSVSRAPLSLPKLLTTLSARNLNLTFRRSKSTVYPSASSIRNNGTSKNKIPSLLRAITASA
jgi:hypothetical protein